VWFRFSLYFSFRRRRNTWNKTGLTHFLVNTWRGALRQNPVVGQRPSVFFYNSAFITSAKLLARIYVIISVTGKQGKGVTMTWQVTVKIIIIEFDVLAWTELRMAWLGYRLKGSPAQWADNTSLNRYSKWNLKKTTFLSCHYSPKQFDIRCNYFWLYPCELT
jgi:hypothetical protein